MRSYSWAYGIFHWFIHYTLTILLIAAVQIQIFPFYLPYYLFGYYMQDNIADIFFIIVVSSLIDLDHVAFFRKFGVKKYIWAQKRLAAPLHNFFFLSIFAVSSAFCALFVSKLLAVMLFSVVLHLLWDIFEDVFIFRSSFRRWEKTWGLDRSDMEKTYNELLQIEAQQPKRESRIKKLRTKLKERIKKKKQVQTVVG
jgi:hypothetical protein